mgnify:CR=1 FL=1|jgi:hypothetical protein
MFNFFQRSPIIIRFQVEVSGVRSIQPSEPLDDYCHRYRPPACLKIDIER